MFVVKFHPQRVWALQIWVQIDLANQLVEAVLSNIGSSTGLIHKQFWLCGWGGLFKPHAVRPVCLKHTGCHMIRPKLTGWSKGQVHLLNLVVTQELPSFKLCHLSFPYFSPNGRWPLTGRCSSSVLKIARCIENGRHMLKPVPWAIWTVKLCWPMIHLRSGSDGPQPYGRNSLRFSILTVLQGWQGCVAEGCETTGWNSALKVQCAHHDRPFLVYALHLDFHVVYGQFCQFDFGKGLWQVLKYAFAYDRVWWPWGDLCSWQDPKVMWIINQNCSCKIFSLPI